MIKPIFTETQTNVSAFFGGPIAAGILMFSNLLRLRKEKQAYITITSTLIFTLSFYYLLFQIPQEALDKFPKPLIPSALGIIIAVVFQRLLSAEVKVQIAEGAKKASNWAVAGVAVIGNIVTAVIFLGVASIQPPFAGEKSTFGAADNEIYFNPKAVSETEVQQLAEELYLLGFFNDKTQSVIKFTRGNEYLLTFQVDQAIMEDEEIAVELKALTWSLEDAFNMPFTIILENYDLSGKRHSKMIEG